MLARTYTALQQFDKALPAYEKVTRLVPDDANLLADYADILAMSQGRSLQGKPMELIQRALKIDPAHQKSLALAGTFEFDKGNYPAAIDYWGRLMRTVPDGSPQAQSIQAGIDEAKVRMGGKPVATAPAQPAVAQAGVAGTIALSDKLKGKAAPTDTVFVFARAAQGPKMPLAIVKIQVSDLPYTFKLDDSMAMSPNMKLSGYAEVVVGARISKSGTATPQTGDLQGLSAPVKSSAQSVKVVIDQILP
jgi:cytochrome c-type biogenesis protein CcmH